MSSPPQTLAVSVRRFFTSYRKGRTMEQTTQSQPLFAAPDILDVIDFCRKHNLNAERVGGWIWVDFPEKPPKTMRQKMREFGFVWSSRRGMWAHNCGKPSKSAYDSHPWDTYEHTSVSRGNG